MSSSIGHAQVESAKTALEHKVETDSRLKALEDRLESYEKNQK